MDFLYFFMVALSVSNLSAGNIANEKGNESWIGVKTFNDNLKVVCGPFSHTGYGWVSIGGSIDFQ